MIDDRLTPQIKKVLGKIESQVSDIEKAIKDRIVAHLAPQAVDELPHIEASARVETSRRLVEKQHARAMHD